jgi:hypothetical protein
LLAAPWIDKSKRMLRGEVKKHWRSALTKIKMSIFHRPKSAQADGNLQPGLVNVNKKLI